MKKGLILVLAALMLAVSLTACAATQPYYDGYSNVSTTRNGYVNGTNGYGGCITARTTTPATTARATARAARQAAEP